ncbi:MAG: hypothetical protein JWL97_3517 [Gemmatimonadales bacterium]|nr:hypothetical protein [Gemmatimonadales bacterium]
MTTSAGVPTASGCQEPDPADPAAVCGASAAADQHCLAHLRPDQRTDFLATLTAGADIDVRGVAITPELLAQLLTSLDDGNGKAQFGNADFIGATFTGGAYFRGATFTGEAYFSGATFTGGADFRGATFTGGADFRSATFTRDAYFGDATFTGHAYFLGATFTRDADFGGAKFFGYVANFRGAMFFGGADFRSATFTRDAYFGDATFTGHAYFLGATFTGNADFGGAKFSGYVANFRGAMFFGGADFRSATFTRDAYFRSATFTGHANFLGATFTGGADFRGATFFGGADFRSATFTGHANFLGATFTGDADFRSVRFSGSGRFLCRAEGMDLTGSEVGGELIVEAAARWVNAARMRGAGRVSLRLRGTSVDLSDAVFTGPVTVHRLQQPIPHLDESDLADPESGQVPAASIDSLRGTDAERLVLTDVDLSGCRFAGMHRVDQLRLDGRCVFATDPSGSRQVLAEEHHWRSAPVERGGAGQRGWTEAPAADDVVGPARLEVLYRQLRKAIEDSKNEPGAADFYYAEMEMRRAAATRRPDKTLLWLYWVSSGYALRARRALAWLAVVIAATIAALTLLGFPTSGTDLNAHGTLTAPTGAQPITVTVHQADPVKALSARAEKATEITLNAVIFRGADTQLTTAGRYIDIVARLLGPLLLGLSVLAVRNQVKR